MIEISDAALQQMLDEDPGGPAYFLNLLRFKPNGGLERYEEYLAAADPFARQFGAELVFRGDAGSAVIGETGQQWDSVVISRYPSRQAFADLIRGPGYQSVAHLHHEALVEAVLQPMSQIPQ